jgi:hypothetical protein
MTGNYLSITAVLATTGLATIHSELTKTVCGGPQTVAEEGRPTGRRVGPV